MIITIIIAIIIVIAIKFVIIESINYSTIFKIIENLFAVFINQLIVANL
jgi:hypothetical protein